ncbi:hypothetical protein DPMN_163075 [Dreissena polymorpha]|uniref:Uncharacterized protein n=1 Tax=Dreissena polymorpha TaxID=45954 RepID=A0A9D4EVX3_DREPO|nr:hypothetical protein DPMN_163075 [Dreissena polymorpha]
MAQQRPTQGAQGLIMGPCTVEIDRIVIRFVQYQFEVNRCRNEEFIVKGNFGLAWSMCVGRPRVGMGPYIVEIDRICNFGWAWSMWVGRPRNDRIVIRYVQYQFEVNRCRYEEVLVKGNFGWAWSMWAERPRIYRIVIRDVQYQFEVNRCRNEEVNFQGSSAYSDGRRTDRQTDRRTDCGDNHNIPAIFKKR